MAKKYIIALDQGTTSSRAIVYDKDAHPISSKQLEFKQYYPHPGWVEHNADEIFKSQLKALETVAIDAEIKKDEIAAIGITNQRETVVLWDKKTGKPVHRAIVWQCRRTAEICEQLISAGHEKMIKEKTGLKIDAYFPEQKSSGSLTTFPV